MKVSVRLLVVGDERVGKSSFIGSFVSNCCLGSVPDVQPDHVLAGQFEGCNLIVMDSSSRPGDLEILFRKICLADCIVLMFDASRQSTLVSLVEKFLPKITQCEIQMKSSKPIIICQNKSDLPLESDQTSIDNTIKELMSTHKNILNFYHCSSYHSKDEEIADATTVFQAAEIAVQCPIQPLYDTATGAFTSKAIRAFDRIYRCFSDSGDGLLSADQLSSLQEICFSSDPLSAEEYKELTEQVLNTTLFGGVTSNGEQYFLREGKFTFAGFLGIMLLYISLDQVFVPWQLLKRAGYDTDLNLKVPSAISSLPAEIGVDNFVAELSPTALHFLYVRILSTFVKDIDLIESVIDLDEAPLSIEQLRDILSVDEISNASAEEFELLSTSGQQHPWSYELSKDRSISSASSSSTATMVLRTGSLFGPASDSDPHEHLECLVQRVSAVRQLGDSSNWILLKVWEWIDQWRAWACIDPCGVQIWLYRLGYMFKDDIGIIYREMGDPDRTVFRTALLGPDGSGKKSLIVASILCGHSPAHPVASEGGVELTAEVVNEQMQNAASSLWRCAITASQSEIARQSMLLHGLSYLSDSCSSILQSKKDAYVGLNIDAKLRCHFNRPLNIATNIPYSLQSDFISANASRCFDTVAFCCSASEELQSDVEGSMTAVSASISSGKIITFVLTQLDRAVPSSPSTGTLQLDKHATPENKFVKAAMKLLRKRSTSGIFGGLFASVSTKDIISCSAMRSIGIADFQHAISVGVIKSFKSSHYKLTDKATMALSDYRDVSATKITLLATTVLSTVLLSLALPSKHKHGALVGSLLSFFHLSPIDADWTHSWLKGIFSVSQILVFPQKFLQQMFRQLRS